MYRVFKNHVAFLKLVVGDINFEFHSYRLSHALRRENLLRYLIGEINIDLSILTLDKSTNAGIL